MSTPRPLLRSLEPVLERLAVTARRASDSVASVLWLLGPGDVCATCPASARCPGRLACLHRVATSADDDLPAEAQSRVPVGSGPLGQAVSIGEVTPADPAELEIAEPAWLTARGVRAAVLVPLVHGTRRIGVLAALCRAPLSEERFALLSATAALGAEAIGNVSAYRDLALDRNRLAAQNARLRSGLGLPLEPEPPADAVAAPAVATSEPALPRDSGPAPAGASAPAPASSPAPGATAASASAPASSPGPGAAAASASAPAPASSPAPGAPVAGTAPPPMSVAPGSGAATVPAPPPAAPLAQPAATAAALAPDVLVALGAMLHAEVAAGLPVRPFSEVQREGILRALERTGWRVSGPKGAAALLGLKPTTLESKMKKLGIRRPARTR